MPTALFFHAGLAVMILVAGHEVLGQAADIPQVEAVPEGSNIIWHLAGPGGGGWIQSLVFDPHNPETLYAGDDVGGFYLLTGL